MLQTLYNTPELSDLYHIANFAYAKPSPLLIQRDQYEAPYTIHSSNGVKQGDPLSTLLFCLAIHQTYEKIVSETNTHIYGFVDDVNVVGTSEEVIKAMKMFQDLLPLLNLSVNNSKSSFVYFHHNTAPLSDQVLQSLEQQHIKIQHYSTDILGAVIAPDTAAEEEHVMKILLNATEMFFKRLNSGKLSAQMAMLLLRSSGILKMNYLIRCMPPGSISGLTREFDNHIINSAAEILGLKPAEFEDDGKPYNTRQKLQLPMRHGGWGLISTTLKSPVAYLASLALTAAKRPTAAFEKYTISQQSQPSRSPVILQSDSRLYQDLMFAIGLVNNNLLDQQISITADSVLPYFSSHPLISESLQHNLIVQAHDTQFHAAKTVIMEKPQENKKIIAHMNCITAPHANDWKKTMPTTTTLTLSTAHYRLAGRLNLGLDPFSYLTRDCRLCVPDENNRLALDSYHFLSCKSSKSRELTNRHNAVVGVLQRFFNYAGAITEREPSRLTGMSRIRPDLSIVLPGHHYLVDVRVTHPLCPSHISIAASKPLAATISAEKEKSRKYNQLAQNIQAEFVPFVVESVGGITTTGQTLLNNVILACSEHQSLWSPRQLSQELYGSISIAIQRGNAQALTSGYHWNTTSTRIMQQPQPNIHPDRHQLIFGAA
jgi:hypothetical protein